MTLAVVLLIFLIGKSRQTKELGKLGGPAGIFNVNEPIIFGLPIIMNPLVIIPWLLAPVVVTIVTYFAMATGIVPKPAGIIVPWTPVESAAFSNWKLLARRCPKLSTCSSSWRFGGHS